MDICSLRALYLSGLQEVRDAEDQFAQVLPGMATSSGGSALHPAVERHVAQTAAHGAQLDTILRRHGTAKAPGCDKVAAALLVSAEKTRALLGDPDLWDAALITALRRIKHHEIAACMAVAAYAAVLLLEIDRRTLLGILAEKRAADQELEGFEGEAHQLALLASTPAYA